LKTSGAPDRTRTDSLSISPCVPHRCMHNGRTALLSAGAGPVPLESEVGKPFLRPEGILVSTVFAKVRWVPSRSYGAIPGPLCTVRLAHVHALGIYTLNRGGRPPFSRCAAHVAGALGPHTHMIHHALTMFAHTHAFAHTRRSRCQPTCRRMLAVPSLVPSSSSTCAHAHITRSVYVHIIRSAPSRLCVSKLVTVTQWHPRRRGWLSCGSPGEAGTHSTLITTAPTLWCTMHASRSGRDVEMPTASIHLPPSHRQPPHHHQQPNHHNPPNTSTPRVCVWS